MAKDLSRVFRVADQIQRELATLIQNEIGDPRLRLVTLTGVEVTRDYSHAKVFLVCWVKQKTCSLPRRAWNMRMVFA